MKVEADVHPLIKPFNDDVTTRMDMALQQGGR